MSAARGVGLTAAVLVGTGLFFAMCARVSDRGRFALAYSTYGAGPDGARAVFELAKEAGYDARRWNEDVASLPRPATLVALGGCDHLPSRPLARPEREALARWIEDGGTYIVAGAAGMLDGATFGVRLVEPDEERCVADDGLLGLVLRAEQRARRAREARAERPQAEASPSHALVPSDEPADSTDPQTSSSDAPAQASTSESGPFTLLKRAPSEDDAEPTDWASAWAGPLSGMPFVRLRRAATIEIEDGVPHAVLASSSGRSAIVVVPRGRGRVVVLASASALQNRDLVEAEGAALFLRILRLYAGEGPVLFDEYHLGAGQTRSTVRYLLQVGAGPLLAHAAVILVFVLLRWGRRFGAPRRDPDAPTIATTSFVGAVGALFSRVGDARGTLAILARHALTEIAARHHLDDVEPTRLERSLRQRHRLVAADAVREIAATAAREPLHSLVGATRAIDAARRRACSEATDTPSTTAPRPRSK